MLNLSGASPFKVSYFLETSGVIYMLWLHVLSIYYLWGKEQFLILSTWLSCPKGDSPLPK